MRVYFRGDKEKKHGHWWYRFRWSWEENGEPRTTEIRCSGRGASKLETKRLEESHREALRRGEVHPLEPWPKVEAPKSRTPRLTDYAEIVWQNIGPHVKPRTQEFYKECTERLERFEQFALLPISEITKATVDSYVAWRLKQRKGNSAHAINGELRTLRRVLRYAVESDLLHHAPAIHCLPADGRERVITSEEEGKYLKRASGDLYDAFIILIDSGLRPDSELFPLKWEDVTDRGIRVRRGKTESAARMVPMTQRVRAVLEMRRTARKGSPYVFPALSDTGHVITFNKRHYKTCEEAKVKCFPLYTLRHTFGTRCAEAGVDRFALAYLMGHSSPTVAAKYYIHVEDQHVTSSFERFAQHQPASLPATQAA